MYSIVSSEMNIRCSYDEQVNSHQEVTACQIDQQVGLDLQKQSADETTFDLRWGDRDDDDDDDDDGGDGDDDDDGDGGGEYYNYYVNLS